MATKQYAVKITTNNIDRIEGAFLESLRYAGLLSSVEYDEEYEKDSPVYHRGSFKMYCPKSIGNPKAWAEMNAERMRTFGYHTEIVEIK